WSRLAPRPVSLQCPRCHRVPHSLPTRRSSDLYERLDARRMESRLEARIRAHRHGERRTARNLQRRASGDRAEPHRFRPRMVDPRSEEHTSELQSRENLVCRLLLEKKKNKAEML